MDDPASGSQSLLTAASAQLFRDVEALLAEQAARYEMELQEREVRKALVGRGLVVISLTTAQNSTALRA